MKKSLHSFLNRCLLILSVCVSAGFFLLNAVLTARVAYDDTEKVSFFVELLPCVFAFAAFALLMWAFLRYKDRFYRISEKKLFIIFSVLYCIAGLYLMLNADNFMRADALFVSEAAKALLEGNLDAFLQGGYMHQYPHQSGLMLYDALLYLFSKNVLIQPIVNLLLVLGTNYLTYKLSDLLFQDRLVNLITIVLSFAFLPQFFFILFCYGNIPGYFFMLLAFYLVVRFTRTRTVPHLLGFILAAAIAILIRKNFLIGVIAMVIYLVLDVMKRFSLKHIIAIILVLACTLVPAKLISSHYLEQVGTADTAGAPSLLWISMGTNIDNAMRTAGWSDASNEYIFMQSGYDAKVAGEVAKERVLENLEKIKQEPVRAIIFFSAKLVSMWCEPMYQSVWSGPLDVCGQPVQTDLLRSLYNGDTAEDVVSGFMRMYMILFWGLALCYLLMKDHSRDGWQLFFLFLLGGFLFHMLWEGKSQYVYQYAFCLVPFVSAGFVALSRKVPGWFAKYKK